MLISYVGFKPVIGYATQQCKASVTQDLWLESEYAIQLPNICFTFCIREAYIP